MTESVLDRKFAGRLTFERLLHALLFLCAVGLCTYQLGQRPYHHDESIHAFYSWKVSQEGPKSYKYDPVYHGLVLYYSSAAAMRVFGDSDFTGRLSAVLFGLGVLAFAWPLRRYLGRWGALAFAALITFSPAWIYFIRFVRHDIYLAFGNMAAVYFAFRYGETRRFRYLPISAAALSLAFCTKEDDYLLTPVFLIAFAGVLVWEILGAKDRAATARAVGTETLTLLRGVWAPLLVSAVVFLTIWTVIYTSLFTDHRYFGTDNIFKIFHPVRDALGYWIGQHERKRIGGPWWYYLPQLILYDPLILLPLVALLVRPLISARPGDLLGRILFGGTVLSLCGFVGAAASGWAYTPLVLLAALGLGTLFLATTWVPDRFARFSILWALAALAIYGWAQEKVPWLLVPQLLPLTLVAARAFGRLIERGRLRSPLIGGPLLLIAAQTVWTLVNVNYIWDAPKPDEAGAALHPPIRHAEMLSYVQSTYDIHKVMRRIDEVGEKRGTGKKERLAISGEATWPFSWYLRGRPVNWAATIRKVDTCTLVVDKALERTFTPVLQERYDVVPFAIRGWWTWESKWPSMVDFVKWLLWREAWSPVGSSDAVLYVQKELGPDIPCGGIDVNPPPAAVSPPRTPSRVEPVAVWGHQGSGRGEFNEPRGLAVNKNGELYVVDSKNNRIQKLAPDGSVLAVWGTQGSGDGQFKDPCGVAVAPDGNVYVADTWNHRVQEFGSDGTFIRQWAETDPPLWGPRGIAVGPDGRVYVTDTGNKRIVAYAADGKRLHVWGHDGSGPGEFIEPVGITVDPSGVIVVADTGNRRLQFFKPDGSFLRQWRVYGWNEFYTEPYLAAHGSDMYVTDSYEHRFARYQGQFNLAGLWGGAGSGNGQFNRPIGIAVGPDGAVFVSDTMNHRIQKFVLKEDAPKS